MADEMMGEGAEGGGQGQGDASSIDVMELVDKAPLIPMKFDEHGRCVPVHGSPEPPAPLARTTQPAAPEATSYRDTPLLRLKKNPKNRRR